MSIIFNIVIGIMALLVLIIIAVLSFVLGYLKAFQILIDELKKPRRSRPTSYYNHVTNED